MLTRRGESRFEPGIWYEGPMSKSAVWLLLAFIMASLAFVAATTVGFWAPLAFIIVGTVCAVIGIVVDVRARQRT